MDPARAELAKRAEVGCHRFGMLAQVVEDPDPGSRADELKPTLEYVQRLERRRGTLRVHTECPERGECECGVVGDVAALDPDSAGDRPRLERIVKAEDALLRPARDRLDLEVATESP